uniref:Uncharacterized protein n=1 Tax=Arundo donax TaxID=35708 RepID=A0A0A9EWJ2_ARUDO
MQTLSFGCRQNQLIRKTTLILSLIMMTRVTVTTLNGVGQVSMLALQRETRRAVKTNCRK